MVDVSADLLQAVKDLRDELRAISERVAALESGKTAAKPAPPVLERVVAAPAPPAPTEEIPEEILLVISAAVAAFLGKRAPVRQVRLLSSTGWAHQGRVFIQASHNLTR